MLHRPARIASASVGVLLVVATYDAFRRFDVTTHETIRIP